jgi:hypothetical protein
MGALHWIQEHWTDLLQNIGIIGGLVFSAYALRKDEKARRIGNLIAITRQYREIWKELYERPTLSRVLKKEVDLNQEPLSEEEALFVNLLILHLSCVYQAVKEGMFVALEGLQSDTKEFFSLPVPRAAWEKMKPFQNQDFVKLIETSMK